MKSLNAFKGLLSGRSSQTNKYTHALRNAVMLVWGLLRLAAKYLQLLTAICEMAPVFLLEARPYFRQGRRAHTTKFSLGMGLEDSLLLLLSKATVA